MTRLEIANIDVSRETIARLEAFSALAQKWTKSINLIAPSTVSDIWTRHIVDSAQIWKFAPDRFDHWVDIGSGGGFPGIVVAVLSKELSPGSRFTLIESDQRKSTFLRTAVRELDLVVDVMDKRIDMVEPQHADVLSARALSSLKELLPHVAQHSKPDGTAIFHKGRKWSEEVVAAQAEWDFELSDYPSMTDPEARIIKLNRIARV